MSPAPFSSTSIEARVTLSTVGGLYRGSFPLRCRPSYRFATHTLVNTGAAALYDRMLTTSEDFSSSQVVLRLESVGRFERTGSIRGNEQLCSRLSVGPAG